MKRYTFNSIILKDKFKYHNEIKKDLLKLIIKSDDKKWIDKDQYFNDDLLKTDWPLADNANREWVKKHKDKFINQFNVFANALGYQKATLIKIWYQRYGYQQTHGWHTHWGNYTGAYYLELPKNAPTTEFLYCNNLEKSFTINVKEGDLIFFPCHFIHRSPKSKSKKIKTIISWNLNFDHVLEFYIKDRKKIKKYE